MAALPKSVDEMVMSLTLETQVKATLDKTFAALLEQLGPGFETQEGKTMQMKLEAWPGGRWYRDLGDGNGHYWATVQAIKKPTLLEFSGPLFASYPFVSNVQYRLEEKNGGTLITFRHTAMGFIEDEHREGVKKGWGHSLELVRKAAEGKAAAR